MSCSFTSRFGREAAHRRMMFRSMTTSLVLHGQIQTTIVKAKILRKFADRMITLAKDGTPAARNKAKGFLTSRDAVQRLFLDYPSKFKYRSGGFTRVRPCGFRKGDNAPMAVIEYINDDAEMKYSDYRVSLTAE